MATDIMVDLETTGTDPARNHIIQISAVKFCLETQEVGEMFDQCLSLQVPFRHWDEGTRDWWMSGDKLPILQQIHDRMRPAADVMDEFQKWILAPLPLRNVRLWAKPMSFEWPFLSSYFTQFYRAMPLHYRHAKDVNTYIFAKGHTDIDAYWKDIGFEGEKHNAIHDVLNQIRGVFKA